MKDSAHKIASLLDELKAVHQRIQQEKEVKTLIADQLANVCKSIEPKKRHDILVQMAELLATDEMSERVTRIMSECKIPLVNVASFQQLLVQATRRRQLFNYQPEWKLNNKRYAYEFVDRLGINRPAVYTFNLPLSDIQVRPRSVLKPENGSSSSGVFVFDEKGGAFEVRTGTYFESSSMGLQKATALLSDGVIKKDAWMLEEFIGDFDNGKPIAPIDLKFYCFYGNVGFVLEVERGEKTRYCEWMPDGTIAHTGRYAGKKFKGNGFTSMQLETAMMISKHVPAPFIRIDFIKGRDSFSFGEFTPRPGQFSSFNHGFDRYLGELYLEAEAKLMKAHVER